MSRLIKVIAICITLLLIIMFIYYTSDNNNESKLECKRKMHIIHTAMLDYSYKHNGNLPWAGVVKKPWDHLQILVNEKYIDDPSVFVIKVNRSDSPARKDNEGNFMLSEYSCSFTTYSKPVSINENSTNIVILANKSIGKDRGFTDGYCYLLIDGSTHFVKSNNLSSDVIITGDK